MEEIKVDGKIQHQVEEVLQNSRYFSKLNEKQRRWVIKHSSLVRFDEGEILMRQGEQSTSFDLLVKGDVTIEVESPELDGPAVVAKLKVMDTIGEMGLLLGEPRSASVVAARETMALRIHAKVFHEVCKQVPAFAVQLSKTLAERLRSASQQLPLPDVDDSTPSNDPELAGLLPLDFIQRHRAVPIALKGNDLTLGVMADPSAQLVFAVSRQLPSFEIGFARLTQRQYNETLAALAGISELVPKTDAPDVARRRAAPTLDELLKRVVEEGASDLHLSANHKPRWRVDGKIRELTDAQVLGEDDVFKLTKGAMSDAVLAQWDETNDADFAYALPGHARFRVNIFRDHHGVGAVFRQIPDKILTLEQLDLPPVVETLCEQPKGMVLVTGPTGSGKSTTLAAMIDRINKSLEGHILTLEDPIEFVHQSRKCLVNQREIGPHTDSFARALKAALREDPDIILVGEMRDLETIALAIEAANTGHLVFGTLHTTTAIGTVDRIIGLFPPAQQEQIRTTLSEVLRGVIAQTLCRRKGGGRVAALEILVCNYAVANMIREGKTHQIATVMSTNRAAGNVMIEDSLYNLVKSGVVDEDEAIAKAPDKGAIRKKLGVVS